MAKSERGVIRKAADLPGVKAAMTARLVISGALCGFQYWLLTTTMEAYHSGNFKVVGVAFIVSILCFVLVAGLMMTGEVGIKKLDQTLAQKKASDDRA